MSLWYFSTYKTRTNESLVLCQSLASYLVSCLATWIALINMLTLADANINLTLHFFVHDSPVFFNILLP